MVVCEFGDLVPGQVGHDLSIRQVLEWGENDFSRVGLGSGGGGSAGTRFRGGGGFLCLFFGDQIVAFRSESLLCRGGLYLSTFVFGFLFLVGFVSEGDGGEDLLFWVAFYFDGDILFLPESFGKMWLAVVFVDTELVSGN